MIANPEMTEVNLYSRQPHPAQALMDKMTKQIKDLGYAGPLEFPALSAAKP
jgi:lipocalin